MVRINEDGTIRLIMQDGINNNKVYNFSLAKAGYTYMYYSNSNVEKGAKYILDNWYDTNIVSNKNYVNKIAFGEYFCEQAKVKGASPYITSENATMEGYSSYTNANFKCEEDVNGKGIVDSSVGLITYDEVLHAGGYNGGLFDNPPADYYLINENVTWTMSPAGVYTTNNSAAAWLVSRPGKLSETSVGSSMHLRPVLNLKADTTVTGLGTSDSHWSVVES